MLLLNEILSIVVVLLLSGNNLAVCVGPAVGSGVLRERDAIAIACVAFTLGLILGEYKFEYYSKLSLEASLIALCSALLVLILGELLKIPMSLVYATTTVTLTVALAAGSLSALVNLAKCILYWILSVPLSIILTSVAAIAVMKIVRSRSTMLYGIARLAVIILTILHCIAFGENNLGFLWALGGGSVMMLPAYIISTLLGVTMLGRAVLRRLVSVYALSPSGALVIIGSSACIAYMATELGIPVSFSVLLICSLSGLSYVHRLRLINYRYIKYALIWTYLTIPLTGLLGLAIDQMLKLLQYAIYGK